MSNFPHVKGFYRPPHIIIKTHIRFVIIPVWTVQGCRLHWHKSSLVPEWVQGRLHRQGYRYEASWRVHGLWEESRCSSWSECPDLSSSPKQTGRKKSKLQAWHRTSHVHVLVCVQIVVFTSGLSRCVFIASTFNEIDSTLHPGNISKATPISTASEVILILPIPCFLDCKAWVCFSFFER